MSTIPVEIRWGDRPPIEQGPISRLAIFALLCSLAAPLALVLGFVLPTKVGALLLFAAFSRRRILWILLAPAYTALFSTRLGKQVRGRMLAWAALALCYGSQLLFAVLFAPSLERRFSLAPYVVLVVILLHLPIFAAECAAAKYAVVSLLAGCALLSLLSCAVLRSREESRRLKAGHHLRQIGVHYQERDFFDKDPPTLERAPHDTAGIPKLTPSE